MLRRNRNEGSNDICDRRGHGKAQTARRVCARKRHQRPRTFADAPKGTGSRRNSRIYLDSRRRSDYELPGQAKRHGFGTGSGLHSRLPERRGCCPRPDFRFGAHRNRHHWVSRRRCDPVARSCRQKTIQNTGDPLSAGSRGTCSMIGDAS
jgi:hypothetical protein